MTEPSAASRMAAAGGAARVVPGQTPAGEPILSALVKRTYDVVPDGSCARAEADRELVPCDEFWDAPSNSSVRHESDLVAFKIGTDVVFEGRVHAPGGSAVASCRAALAVAGRAKQILVIGDRVAYFNAGGVPGFTDPTPFTTMDVRYERAYGGTDVFSDPELIQPYPFNPLGRGFVVANSHMSVDRLPLPNLEDPGNALTPENLCLGDYARWRSRPFPSGLGWYPSQWAGRTLFAGVMPRDRSDAETKRLAYAELLPEAQRDAYLRLPVRAMDFSYFQGASRGLAMPYLRGGEEVELENLSPEGRLRFRLPVDAPRVCVDIGYGQNEPAVVVQTVLIRMEARQVDIVWRGAIPYPGLEWLPHMQKLDLLVA